MHTRFVVSRFVCFHVLLAEYEDERNDKGHDSAHKVGQRHPVYSTHDRLVVIVTIEHQGVVHVALKATWQDLCFITVTSRECHGVSNHRHPDVCSIVILREQQRTTESSALFMESTTTDFPHKWSVMWEAFPYHDVI